MSYQVLARKYRPKSFDEVVGQRLAVQALSNALDNDRLHHAYLFTGTRGVGKTTIARILANCLSCAEGVTSKPCGQCEICHAFANGSFMDLIEVDAASRTGVDNMRELLSNLEFAPVSGRFKIFLIDEVHMLSEASFNALLKTLEEPPDHVKFLLATTNPKKIPITVLSRCLQFHLRNIPADVIADKLREVVDAEEISADDAALATIARAANGSMRDGLSIADQAVSYCGGSLQGDQVVEMLGTAREDEPVLLVDKITRGDHDGFLDACSDLSDRSVDFADTLEGMQRVLHELSVAQVTSRPLRPELSEIAARVSAEWTQIAYQILIMGGRDLIYAPTPRVGFEMTGIRLLDFEPLAAPKSVVRPEVSMPNDVDTQPPSPDDAGEARTDEQSTDEPGPLPPDPPGERPHTRARTDRPKKSSENTKIDPAAKAVAEKDPNIRELQREFGAKFVEASFVTPKPDKDVS